MCMDKIKQLIGLEEPGVTHLDNVVSICSGFGQVAMALNNIGIQVDSFYYSEINNYATSFMNNNKKILWVNNFHELGDFNKVDIYKDLKNIKQAGPLDLLSVLIPRGLFDTKNKEKLKEFINKIGEIIKEYEPINVIIETIPEILTKKIDTLRQIQGLVSGTDYYTDIEKMYSPDYGLPQNRTRVIITLTNERFTPPSISKKIGTIRDYLIETPEDKYNLSTLAKNRLVKRSISSTNSVGTDKSKDVVGADKSKSVVGTESSVMKIVNWNKKMDKSKLSYLLFDFGKGKRSSYYQVHNVDSIAPTLDSDNIIKIIDEPANNLKVLTSSTIDSVNISTLHPNHSLFGILDKHKVRRLTPVEYFNLQGYSHYTDIFIYTGISDTQLYTMVEKTQDLNLLTKIFKQIY